MIQTIDSAIKGHEKDPDYELRWDDLSELLKTEHPLHDLVTDVIDEFSAYDKDRLRACIGYFDAFAPEYKMSRTQWLNTAKKLRGGELTPDDTIMVVNKHRIYFAVTHPRKMNIHTHNVYEENVVADFLLKVKESLGIDRCRVLGFCFES
jgi:DNA-binding LytR/AlgR family response regulator